MNNIFERLLEYSKVKTGGVEYYEMLSDDYISFDPNKSLECIKEAINIRIDKIKTKHCGERN